MKEEKRKMISKLNISDEEILKIMLSTLKSAKEFWEIIIKYDLIDAYPLNESDPDFELENEIDLAWGFGDLIDQSIYILNKRFEDKK